MLRIMRTGRTAGSKNSMSLGFVLSDIFCCCLEVLDGLFYAPFVVVVVLCIIALVPGRSWTWRVAARKKVGKQKRGFKVGKVYASSAAISKKWASKKKALESGQVSHAGLLVTPTCMESYCVICGVNIDVPDVLVGTSFCDVQATELTTHQVPHARIYSQTNTGD